MRVEWVKNLDLDLGRGLGGREGGYRHEMAILMIANEMLDVAVAAHM